jgi:hypothetical protein
MDIKKLALWLFIVGGISLVAGLVIALLSFDLARIPINLR